MTACGIIKESGTTITLAVESGVLVELRALSEMVYNKMTFKHQQGAYQS